MPIENSTFGIATVGLTLLLGAAEPRAEEMLPLLEEHDLPAKVEQMAGSENADLPVILGPLAEPPGGFAARTDGSGLKDLHPLPEGAALPGLDQDSLVGARLLDAEGQPSGRIEAVLSDAGGEPLAVLVHSGGFLGIGGHSFVVPLTALDIEAADGEGVPSSIIRSQIALLPSPPSDEE